MHCAGSRCSAGSDRSIASGLPRRKHCAFGVLRVPAMRQASCDAIPPRYGGRSQSPRPILKIGKFAATRGTGKQPKWKRKGANSPFQLTSCYGRSENTQLNPCDVQWQGDLLQRMGAPVPAELVVAYRSDGIHIYEEDGVWWAAPMQADDI